MAKGAKRFTVTPGSELDRLLDEASGAPMLVERNGVVYRVDTEIEAEDIWAGYDPSAAGAALKQATGSWKDIDADGLIAELYQAREEGSRPTHRP